MGIVENTKDLAGLIQRYSEAGLYRKIVDLEEESVQLRRKLTKAEGDLVEAREALATKAAMQFRAPYCWQDGDETPFCPKCWEGKDNLAVHLPALERVFAGIVRKRRHCKTDLWEERFKPQQRQLKPGTWS
jgi:hypothetical protein